MSELHVSEMAGLVHWIQAGSSASVVSRFMCWRSAPDAERAYSQTIVPPAKPDHVIHITRIYR